MKLKDFKEKLKSYSEKDIILTKHAKLRLIMREIELKEVIENLLNPLRLIYFEEEAINSKFKKYNCYFYYSKKLTHRYVFTTNGKLLIVTIIKINRPWQNTIKKK